MKFVAAPKIHPTKKKLVVKNPPALVTSSLIDGFKRPFFYEEKNMCQSSFGDWVVGKNNQLGMIILG